MLGKLISRNLKLYVRDKTATFFSLLSVIIIIVLYILFLAQMQVDTVDAATNHTLDKNSISYLINSWILSGLLSVTVLTSTLGALSSMVLDRERRISMDFKSSPLRYMSYPVASVIAAFIVGTAVSIFSLAVYSLYIFVALGYSFDVQQYMKAIGFILLSTFTSAALMGFMVSFFKTSSAFYSATFIIGTIIGFINGLYVPMKSLPNFLKVILNYIPFPHIASVFRQILMEQSIVACFGEGNVTVQEGYGIDYGIYLKASEGNIDFKVSMIFIICIAIVSLVLFFINYNRKSKEI